MMKPPKFQKLPPIDERFCPTNPLSLSEGVHIWVALNGNPQPAQIVGNSVTVWRIPISRNESVHIEYNDPELSNDAQRLKQWMLCEGYTNVVCDFND